MPAVTLSNFNSVLQTNNPNVATTEGPLLQQPFVRNIREVYNVPGECLTVNQNETSTDPIVHRRGKKLEHIKTSFSNGIKSLKKYNISINTKGYEQLGPSGLNEMSKAIDNRSILFERGSWVGKDDTEVLRFNLPKEKENFRVELAHKNPFNMQTDSIYGFQMRLGYAAYNAIFFQLKETGGNMKTSGGGRPAISLNVRNENEIFISVNSENGRVLKKKIAVLDCPQAWYTFKIRVIWNRNNPLIQVAINGKILFYSDVSFGAHNSKNHYSKFGIYIPAQKTQDGIKSTSLLFDNVHETHRRYSQPT
ncbi:hypothetical protein EHW66_13210 [Erwinia psidii]|uniref:heparin lyase I family protein n=1 Tax=Erwinia psidii TaxID=69224 RepID=UPI00226B6FE9|nr:heparin lyase I family protein [Erwinia psidii]MCX8958770.1 hypothetical protein [Erwinia psidii]MCX8965919.1 hypothetical protein [Erwinia psidii]